MPRGKAEKATLDQVRQQVAALRIYLARTMLRMAIAELRANRRADPELYRDVMQHIRESDQA